MYDIGVKEKTLGVALNQISLGLTASPVTLGVCFYEGFTAEIKTSPFAWLYGDLQVMLYGDGTTEIIYGS